MPTNILRITLRDSLPCQEERNQVLRDYFDDEITFHEFTPPENPGELFEQLREKVFDLQAVAVEMDSRDRMLTALLGAGVWMKAFLVPVLYPLFKSRDDDGSNPITYPKAFQGADDLYVPKGAGLKFSGYVELVDVNAVTKLSEIGR